MQQKSHSFALVVFMTGNELKNFRKQLSLTQSGLAEKLLVKSNTVARWERNERKIPSHLPLALKTVEREVKAEVGK